MTRQATATTVVAGLLVAAGLAGCAGSETSLKIATSPHCSDFFFPIYFADRSAELTKSAVKVLANAGAHSAGCRVASVEVIGLADYRGPAQPNLELSRQRAQSVAAALGRAGLPEPAFKLSAVGDAGAYNPDGTLKPLRRRADVTIRFMP